MVIDNELSERTLEQSTHHTTALLESSANAKTHVPASEKGNDFDTDNFAFDFRF